MTRRGDVVIVEFPYISGGRGKNRPALVVQSDRNNLRMENTIVAMITGNTRLALKEPTQLLIDPFAPEGQASGLSYPSSVKCENLYTVGQQDIICTIGSVSASTMERIDECLKAALDLP